MEHQEIYNRIVTIIHEKLSAGEELLVTPNSTLEDLGADSLDRIELVMTIEEDFDIAIKDEDADQIHTVNDVVMYVQKALAKE